jgi:sugar lactone lactonase YvrE
MLHVIYALLVDRVSLSDYRPSLLYSSARKDIPRSLQITCSSHTVCRCATLTPEHLTNNIMVQCIQNLLPNVAGARACMRTSRNTHFTTTTGSLQLRLVLLGVLSAVFPAQVAGDCISTFAGTGVQGYNGDGIAATSALLSNAGGSVSFINGRVIISDYTNHRIRSVETNGTIFTIAGTGSTGFTNDGIPATSSRLASPWHSCVDAVGRIVIADYFNHRIRRVELNGTIVSLAGTGSSGYTGEGVIALTANLNTPRGVAVDPLGRIVIAEEGNMRIRRIELNGSIFTVAGTGSMGYNGDNIPATTAKLYTPRGLAVDSTGIIYIADTNNDRVRWVDMNNIIHTLAGLGVAAYNGDGILAINATLNSPQSVNVDSLGRVLIADASNRRVRRVETNGTIFTIAGTGVSGYSGDGMPATSAQMFPTGVAVDAAGRVFITDTLTFTVRVIDQTCSVYMLSATYFPLPPSHMRVWITNSRPGAATNVSVNGLDCSNLQYVNGNITAVCPLVVGPNIALRVYLSPALSVPGQLSVSASSVVVSPVNRSVAWGSNLSLAFVPNIAANVSSIDISYNGVTTPCTDVYVVNSSSVMCGLRVPLEAGFSQPLDVRVTYSEGTTTIIGAATTNLTLIRPVLASFAPLVVQCAGGENVTIMLPLPVPSVSICSVRPNGWLGSVVSPFCQYLNASAVSCMVPPGTSTFARITLELCGAFNTTSDGLIPTGLVQPGLLGISRYISYNPSPYFTSSFAASAPVFLQKPSSNATIASTSLDLLGPMITGVFLAGSPCSSFTVVGNTTLLCMGWPYDATAGAPFGMSSVQLTVSLIFRGQIVVLTPLLPGIHAPQVTGISPSTVSAGTRIVVIGTFFLVSIGTAPNITVGGLLCTGMSGISDASIQCNVPSVIPDTTPGFPTLAVVVSVSAGSSKELVPLTISIPPSVTFSQASSSALSSTALFPIQLSPAPNLTVSGDASVTCVLSIAAATCPLPTFQFGAPYIQTLPDTALLGTVSRTVSTAAGAANMNYSLVGIRAAAGCQLNVSVQCTDASFRSFTTSTPMSIIVAMFGGYWSTSSTTVVTAPLRPIPAMLGIFNTTVSSQSGWPSFSQLLSCVAVLAPSLTMAAPDTPLSQYVGSLSTSSAIVTAVNASSAVFNFTSLTTNLCTLGNTYSIQGECTWLPTGERIRLPIVPVVTPNVTVGLSALGWSMLVDAYYNISMTAVISIGSASPIPFTTPPVCLVQLLSASTPAIQLASPDALTLFLTYANGLLVPGNTTIYLQVQGPPSGTGNLRLSCSVWGQVVYSNVVAFKLSPFRVVMDVPTVASLPTPIQHFALPSAASASTTVQVDGSTLPVPSADGSSALIAVSPRVTIASHAHTSISCTLSISSYTCVPPGFQSFGVGYVPSAIRPTLVGDTTLTALDLASDATEAFLPVWNIGVYAASGCIVNVSATCLDGAGRQGISTTPATVSLSTKLGVTWSTSSATLVTAPLRPIPAMLGIFNTTVSSQSGWPSFSQLLSCVAVLAPSLTMAAPDTPLSQYVGSLSTSSAIVTAVNTSSAVFNFTSLTTNLCTLGNTYSIQGECTWLPTGERIRLPIVAVITPNVTVGLSSLGWTALIDAYYNISMTAVISVGSASPIPFSTPPVCLVQLLSASTPAIQLSAPDALTLFLTHANGSLVPGNTTIYLQVQGPPSGTGNLRLSCTVWGQVVYSNVVAFKLSPFRVVLDVPAVASLPTPVQHFALPSAASASTTVQVDGSTLPVPSADGSSALIAISPRVTIASHAHTSISCTLSISSYTCVPPGFQSFGVGYVPSAIRPTLVGDTTLTALNLASDATEAFLPVWNIGVYAASGCIVNVSATCLDGAGRQGTATAPATVSLSTKLGASWTTSAATLVAAPLRPIPAMLGIFNTTVSSQSGWPSFSQLLSCVAVLAPSLTMAAPDTPLSQYVGSLSTSSAIVTAINSSSAVFNFTSLTTNLCTLGNTYSIQGECTWLPTGERIRLPIVPVLTPNVTVGLSALGWSMLVDAYYNISMTAVISIGSASPIPFSTPPVCLVQLLSASTPAIQLAAPDALTLFLTYANGSLVPGNTTIYLQVQGPPSGTGNLRLSCTVWGQVVYSNVVAFKLSPFRVVLDVPTVASLPTPIQHFALPSAASASTTVQVDGSTLPVPSADGSSALIAVSPRVTIASHAHTSISCTLSISSYTCVPPGFQSFGVGYVPSAIRPTLVGDTTLTALDLASDATEAFLPVWNIGVCVASDCIVNVSATCLDGVGRQGTAMAPLTLGFSPMVTAWENSTATVSKLDQITPGILASIPFRVTLPATADIVAQVSPLPISCLALVLDASTVAANSTSLSTFSRFALTQASIDMSGAVTVSDGAASKLQLVAAFPAMDATGATLGNSYFVHGECTWLPTGERMRLAPLPVSVINLSIRWVSSTSITTLASTPLTLTFQLVSTSSVVPVDMVCGWRTSNVSTYALVLVATDFILRNAVPDQVLPASVTLQGASGASMDVVMQCTLWGQLIVSPPLHLRTTGFGIRNMTTLPSTFIPSDASQPFPISASPMLIKVVDDAGGAVLDTACSLSSASPGVSLVSPAGQDAATIFNGVPADEAGIVSLPQHGLLAQFGGDVTVTLRVTCLRSTGDATSPLIFNVTMTQLRMVVCTAPITKTTSQTPLPPFSVGIAMQHETAEMICGASAAVTVLPSIGCSVLQGSREGASANTSLFLQGSAVVLDATTRMATVSALTLTATPAFAYPLVLVCAIGSIPIPPSYAFHVELSGCAPGTQPSGVFCQKCAGDQFSMGSVAEDPDEVESAFAVHRTCQGCPAAGATCNEGIIRLHPDFFQAPSQFGQPLGPSTELFSCPTKGACLVNDTTLSYTCAPGYSGALCAVCDESMNYAQFGAACGPCWSPGSSAVLLVFLSLLIIAALTRVALRANDGVKSDASIALKILLGYIQAVGSLRAFKAGGTAAYHDVMGWTDTVSANPYSFGALQCLLRPVFLGQYLATVFLPFIAAALVIVIFVSAVAARSWTCKPRPSFDRAACISTVRKWLLERRHFATLLFVLFLAYMSIISSSLKTLDCLSRPIDGVYYLRQDLRVSCYTGDQAIASVVAYCVLLLLGIGFPVGLFYLLSTASPQRLADPQFQSTFGFLYGGYRANHSQSKAPEVAQIGEIIKARKPLLPCCCTFRMKLDHLMWWESVVLLRKAGIVLLAVLVTNPYYQCGCATLWLLMFLLLHVQKRPYANELFNGLETLGLVSACATAIISSLLLQYNVSDAAFTSQTVDTMSNDEWGITIVLAVINVSTLCVMAGTWIQLQWRRAKQAKPISKLLSRIPSAANNTPQRTTPSTPSRESSSRVLRVTLPTFEPLSFPLGAAGPMAATPDESMKSHANPLLLMGGHASTSNHAHQQSGAVLVSTHAPQQVARERNRPTDHASFAPLPSSSSSRSSYLVRANL